jgi:hypothetical protein
MWLTLLPVILQFGLPFAESLFTKISSGAAPTAQDFADLRTLASANAKSVMTAQLIAQGVDPASPRGVALLALVV